MTKPYHCYVSRDTDFVDKSFIQLMSIEGAITRDFRIIYFSYPLNR